MYYKTVIFLSPNCFRTPRRASFCFGTSIVNHHIHGECILKLIEKHRPLKRSADQLIGLVCRLLSVSRIVVEEAKFDLYKIQNPDVEGVEYQQEPQYGFDNLETKTPTFMGMIRNKLIKRLKAKYDNMVHTTFGYITHIGRLPNACFIRIIILKTGSAHGHARGLPPIKNYVNPTDK